MSGDAATVLARLEGGALDELVALVTDWLLGRPISSLIDPGWIAEMVIAALDGAGADPRTEQWLREQVAELRARVPAGNLRARVPTEVSDPLRAVVARPIVFETALVERLIDHEATRRLLKDVLLHALQAFVTRLRTIPVPDVATGRLSGLSRLRKLGDNVLGGLGGEFEKHAQDRAREFVDGALSALMGQVATHLTDPVHAPRYGAWRGYLVDTVLDTELAVLAAEVDKLDPEQLVATALGVARSLARRDGLSSEIERAVTVVLEGTGGRSVREYLAEAGIDEVEWQARVREQLVARGRELLAEERFRDWVERLVE